MPTILESWFLPMEFPSLWRVREKISDGLVSDYLRYLCVAKCDYFDTCRSLDGDEYALATILLFNLSTAKTELLYKV